MENNELVSTAHSHTILDPFAFECPVYKLTSTSKMNKTLRYELWGCETEPHARKRLKHSVLTVCSLLAYRLRRQQI